MMKKQKLKAGTFMGKTLKSTVLEGFNLSVSTHHQNATLSDHEHEYPYLSLLLSGPYRETSILSEQTVLPGTSLFRPGNYVHKDEIGSRPSLCFNIEIQKHVFGGSLRKMADSYVLFERFNVEIMKIYLGFQSGFSKELLSLQVEEGLYHLFAGYLGQRNVGRAFWINKIKRRVRMNPALKYEIDEVAATLHIHPIYFVRKFKEATGVTFGEFLVRQRLERALDLMLTSGKNLTVIATESGFYDQSHFIRHFRNAFHVSPSKYRKIVKG